MKIQKFGLALIAIAVVVDAVMCIREELEIITGRTQIDFRAHSAHLGILLCLVALFVAGMMRLSRR